MNCSTCGSPIPQDAVFCPGCGAPSPAHSSNAYGQTSRVSQPPVRQDVYTAYGSDPYQQSAQQYNANPYSMPAMSPSYPSPPSAAERPKRGTNLALIVFLLLLAVIVVGGGSFMLVNNVINNNNDQANVNATATVLAKQATTDPNLNPYAPKTGTLVMNDPMHDNSKGYKWDEATMAGNTTDAGLAKCGFRDTAYHVSREKKGALICDPEAPELVFNNLAFEARLTLKAGSEEGLVVRFDQTKGVGYLFSVISDGSYVIDTVNFNAPDNNNTYKVLHSGKNAQIKQGLNQTNLVAIVANGNSISVYVNGTFIDTVQDASFSSGQIGVFGYGESALDLAANDVRVWKI